MTRTSDPVFVLHRRDVAALIKAEVSPITPTKNADRWVTKRTFLQLVARACDSVDASVVVPEVFQRFVEIPWNSGGLRYGMVGSMPWRKLETQIPMEFEVTEDMLEACFGPNWKRLLLFYRSLRLTTPLQMRHLSEVAYTFHPVRAKAVRATEILESLTVDSVMIQRIATDTIGTRYAELSKTMVPVPGFIGIQECVSHASLAIATPCSREGRFSMEDVNQMCEPCNAVYGQIRRK